jgi:hypothetical protein
MVLILQYQDPTGHQRSFWIRQHEAVTVGSGVQSDQRIFGDEQIDKCHFHISYQDEKWILESVTDRPLQINGEYVRIRVLQEMDRILAGKTTFLVQTVPKATKSSAPHAAHDVFEKKQPVEAESLATLERLGPARTVARLPGEVIEFCAENVDEQALQLLQCLNSIGMTSMVWNRKALGDPLATLTGWSILADDLFVDAPAEIKQENSLAIGSLDWEKCDPNYLLPLLRSDTAILIFHTVKTNLLIPEKKPFWGWFARPSILRSHMQHGSQMLLSHLVQTDMVVSLLDHSSKRGIFLYGREESIPSIPLLNQWLFLAG